MKWIPASERLPGRLIGYVHAKSESMGPVTAFYTEAECTEITFDDEYGYEDENGYLLEGWYRVYDSVRDGMHFTVPISDIIEWLDESPPPIHPEEPEGQEEKKYIGAERTEYRDLLLNISMNAGLNKRWLDKIEFTLAKYDQDTYLK